MSAAHALGAEWLLARLESNGSLRGATDLTAYYKTPCALLWSGYPDAARQVLSYVEERYLLSGGDLDGSGVPWLDQYRIYPHAWLALAAFELRNDATAQALAGYLTSHWNEHSGGFRARADGSEEIMTTSMAGIACLAAGRTEAADGVAKWLRLVIDSQPDITKELIHVWQPGQGLVRGDGSVAWVVDTAKPRQWYFMYGISAAFLAEHGKPDSLEVARLYLRASSYCNADRYSTPQSGKLGWGAAWMYGRSGDPADLAVVDAVTLGLTKLQCGDGSWNPDGVYESKPTRSEGARFDVTAEFVALLAQMGAITRV